MNMYGIKELDVDTLQSYLQEGRALRLLDVRGIAEMEQGMIPNAEKLPLHTLHALQWQCQLVCSTSSWLPV